MAIAEVLAVVGIIAVASFVQSSIGFGLGLIAMPLLGLVLEVKTATPMVTLMGVVISVVIVAFSWRQVEWKSLRYLLAGSVIGIPLGIFVLKNLPSEPIRYTLGVIVILFALHGLFGKRRLPFRPIPATEMSLGFISGAFSGGFSIGGPPVIAYGALRGWEPAVFRATLQAFFIVSGVVALVGHGVAGLLSKTVFSLFWISLPVMGVSTIIGRWVNARIDPRRFRGLIYVILLLLGALLFVR